MSQQNYSPVNIYPSIPPTADILSGGVTTSTNVIITIPANRSWMGSLTLEACGSVIANQPQAAAAPSISTLGGATPASAQLCAVALIVSSCASTATSASGTMTIPNVVVTAGTTDTTLAVVPSNSGFNSVRYVAQAVGILL